MAKNKARKLLRGTIVLQEVFDGLDMTGAPVNVICSAKEGFKVQDVMDFLGKLGIEVRGQLGEQTDYYVFATLKNEKEAVKIDKPPKGKGKQCIGRVWIDKAMKPCVKDGQKTINASAAKNLFEMDGDGIQWAVLDTGIDIGHAWFKGNRNCTAVRQFDFSGEGGGYANTHGTHVAGIITSIAPKVKIWDYKVLGEKGGSASTIIRAMYDIRKRNFEASETVIHGVNMSLGGPVQVGSYGCGWSPECQEANRLMASGVVVCVAAGNDGYKHVATVAGGELKVFPTFVDLGIGDPGNAEDIITVGSVHKKSPHSYGPSYFSSKGPTGDGRFKPDCVAPGENITSASAGGGEISLDGTSMATPHVSGAIALFQSAKPEFKGRAREVKEILLKSCTDLKRDRNFQGAGLVDVLRMIQSV